MQSTLQEFHKLQPALLSNIDPDVHKLWRTSESGKLLFSRIMEEFFSISDQILSGNIEDYAEYKEKVGYLTALEDVLKLQMENEGNDWLHDWK